MSYRNGLRCTTRETPSFLSFSKTAKDKLPTVSSTAAGPRHDGAVKRNCA